MRFLILLCALGASFIASAQGGSQASLFNTVRPDILVVVRKHPTGSEIVSLTAVDPKYPLDILRNQAEQIAQGIGQKAQGLMVNHEQIARDDPSLVYARAQFGVSGLSDPAKGVYHLEPIVRALAGSSTEPGVTGISIQFEGMQPTKQTLQRYEDDAVSVELSTQSGQIGIEYRVLLKTQDPTKIHIPDGTEKKKPVEVPKPKSSFDWVMAGFAILGALATGALVYSVLLWARPNRGPSSR